MVRKDKVGLGRQQGENKVRDMVMQDKVEGGTRETVGVKIKVCEIW